MSQERLYFPMMTRAQGASSMTASPTLQADGDGRDGGGTDGNACAALRDLVGAMRFINPEGGLRKPESTKRAWKEELRAMAGVGLSPRIPWHLHRGNNRIAPRNWGRGQVRAGRPIIGR